MSIFSKEIPIKFKNILLIILGILLLLFLIYKIGYYFGNKNIKTETVTKIEYIQGTEITGNLVDIEPISIDIPNIQFINSYRDTTWITRDSFIVQPIDSAKILADYLTKRNYELPLFDIDTVGVCKINTSVQYNKITALSYQFTPVIKTVTTEIYNKAKWEFFGGAGIVTNSKYHLQLGAYKGHVGASVGYLSDFKNDDNGMTLNFFYKY